MRNKYWVLTISIISLIFIQASCKTNVVGGSADCPKMKMEQLEPLLRKRIQDEFSFYYAKVGVDIEGSTMSQSFKASVKMKPDSAFAGTIKVAGIMGAGYLIDQDTFAYKYKIKKCYQKGSFDELSKVFGTEVGYSFAQELVLGQAVGQQEVEQFYPHKTDSFYVVGSHDQKTFERLDTYNLSDAEKKDIYLRYTLHCETLDLVKVEIFAPSDDTRIRVDYLKREKINGLSFPEETLIKIDSPKDIVTIRFDYSSTELDEEKSIHLSIPDSYSICE